MALNAYEIRLEALKMAKDLCMDDWYREKDKFVREWEEKCAYVRDSSRVQSVDIPAYPNIPDVPSPNKIVTKAKELYKFINDKG